jgi:hypothetical protein
MATKKKAATQKSTSTVTVRTPNVPGSRQVDATKYAAMEKVLLRVMPSRAPGITQGEMWTAVAKLAPKDTFPKKTHAWWAKCVQLDLEARGVLARAGKPARWHRVRR